MTARQRQFAERLREARAGVIGPQPRVRPHGTPTPSTAASRVFRAAPPVSLAELGHVRSRLLAAAETTHGVDAALLLRHLDASQLADGPLCVFEGQRRGGEAERRIELVSNMKIDESNA